MNKLLLCIILFLSHCASTSSQKDRRNDSMDMINFSHDQSFAFWPNLQIDISRFSFGFYKGRSNAGCKYAKCFSYGDSVTDWSDATLLYSKKEHFFADHDSFYISRNKTYLVTSPYGGQRIPLNYYGRLRIRAAVIWGFSLEVNLFELADFIVGFAGYDPLNDDMYQYLEGFEKRAEKHLSDTKSGI